MNTTRFLMPLRYIGATLCFGAMWACGGGGGSDASPAAPVVTAPTIAAQPAALSVFEGTAAAFNVQANGAAPLTYQWLRNGVTIAGATDAVYVISSAALADTGAQFSVVVTNPGGSVTSVAAALTVNPAPIAATIVQGPATTVVTAGQPATLQVTATGSAPLAYQWYRNGSPIGGATESALAIPAASWDDHHGAAYTVTVTNAGRPAGVTSEAATILLRPDTTGLVCTDQGWCWANPRPAGLHYSAIARAGTAAIAVTFEGGIFRTADSGATWTAAIAPEAELGSVAFGSPLVGLAVGQEGAVLRTTDGGHTWSHATAAPALRPAAVAFASPTVAVVVGGSQFGLRTTDGGSTWSQIAVVSAGAIATHVAFNGSGRGVAIGSDSNLYSSTDSGATWSQTSAIPAQVFKVAFAGETTLVAAGVGQVLRSTDAGATWTAHSIGYNTILRDLAFMNASVGISVGLEGIAVRTGDGGLTWQIVRTPVISPDRNALTAVAFAENNVALAAGEAATLARSLDTGATWTDLQSGDRTQLWSVEFGGERFGVAVGSEVILRSQDGGRSWSRALLAPFGTGFFSVAFANVTTAVAVGTGGTILRTTDSGGTWSQVASGTTALLTKVVFLSSNVGLAIGQVPTVILRTVDGGASWTRVPGVFPTLDGLARIDETNAIAVGGTAALKSADGGVSWNPLPSSSGIGDFPLRVAFADSMKGIVVSGTGQARFTTDGGTTWIASTQPRLMANPGSIAMLGSQGYLVGVTARPMNGAFTGNIQETNNGGASFFSVHFPVARVYDVTMLRTSVTFAVGENGAIVFRSF